jgi:hypothetical protein
MLPAACQARVAVLIGAREGLGAGFSVCTWSPLRHQNLQSRVHCQVAGPLACLGIAPTPALHAHQLAEYRAVTIAVADTLETFEI